MNTEVILIYETDAWHGFSSRNLIGIATTEPKRDTIVRKHLRSLRDRPSVQLEKQAVEEIRSNGQTMCLNERCDIEIDTERVNLDEYLL